MHEPRCGPRRSTRRRRAAMAAVAAGLSTVLAATLSACSQSSGSVSHGITLTFTWWGNDDRAARTEKAVELFEKEHPGVTVRTNSSDFGSYLQKLATQAAGGEVPDVAQLDYRQMSQYSDGGALLPLDEDVQKGAIRTDDVDKQLLHTGAYRGKLYAVPMGQGITGFAYDASLYEKAGLSKPKPSWTWEDWADANRRIAKLGLKGPDGGAVTGSNDPGTNEDVFEDWLRSHGKSLYQGQERKLGFTEDDLTAFWTFCDTLRREGAIAQAKDTTQADSAEHSPMGRGLAAADYTWDAPFPGYPPLLGDSVHFEPVPTVDGHIGAYFKPSMLMGIGAHTAHPKEAAELVDFLLNDRKAGSILGFTRSTPPNRTVAADVAKTLEGPELEIYRYAQRIRAYGVEPPPPSPPSGDVAIQSAFNRNYQRVMFGMATPRQGARELISEANRELTS
ncbi:ABC transporter substrate-binding protein [Streptomyces sp. NPDC050560]|uniref:ABC transporter substrate-binding protein n=1 Tax=Streptomyces sp. NPDC050560 TaxID=3365630 RepID=UPI0037B2570D